MQRPHPLPIPVVGLTTQSRSDMTEQHILELLAALSVIDGMDDQPRAQSVARDALAKINEDGDGD